MRLWKWLKLGFDQTFSGAWWKQLLWLTSVIVFFFVYPASPGRYLPPDGKCLHFSGRTRNPKTEFLGFGRTFYRSGRIRQSKRGQPSLCLIGRTGRHVVTYGYFNFGIFEYAGTPGGTFPQRRQPLCFFQSHHYIGYRRYGALSDPATPTKCRV